MPRRFPLYAKILLWFFLNLILLATAFYVLFRAQFRFGLDWLLSGAANDRIEAVSNLILSELAEQPQTEWSSVVSRFGSAYQNKVQFFVFRDDETQLAGDPIKLPPQVRDRLGGRRGFRPSGPPPERPEMGPGPDKGRPPFGGSPYGSPPDNPSRGLRPKFIVHTTDPPRYWVLVPAMINRADQSRPSPATLLVRSNSLSGGGLFFDVKPWIAVSLGAVVFSALLWLPLVRGINRSIAQMTQATRQIAEGRFDVRVAERRRDELGALGQAINQMAVRLAGLVAGQKRFLGDVAHELCSPLAKLRVALGILEQRADGYQKPYVTTANDKAEHMAGLVNELLSFSKMSLAASPIKLQPVSVREVAQKAIGREATEGAQIQVEIPEALGVIAEPELLVRSLSNLLRNAIRYAGQAGAITVSAKREDNDVVLTVSDCGPGVPEIELAQIFDPFYRVDSSRDRATGGVGLGLAIVQTCVESCRGTVLCRNRQPTGLEVILRLPAAQKLTPAKG